MMRVLLVTPDRNQGTQWKQECEAGQNFLITLSTSASEALAEVIENYYSVAVVDAELPDMHAAELGQALLAWFGKIQLVVLVARGGWMDDRLSKLEPQAVLEKPFTSLQLRELLSRLLAAQAPLSTRDFASLAGSSSAEQNTIQEIEITPIPETRAQSEADVPAWLEDVNRLAQHLTRLTFSSSAKASLITSASRLWAYAGELPQPAAQELAQNVMHYWARYGGKDLARFVRLDTTGDEYLLYATGLENRLVLALAFESGVPFSQIRSQAAVFARALSEVTQKSIEPTVVETFPAALPASGVLTAENKTEKEGWIEKVAWTEEPIAAKSSVANTKPVGDSPAEIPDQPKVKPASVPEIRQPDPSLTQKHAAFPKGLFDEEDTTFANNADTRPVPLGELDEHAEALEEETTPVAVTGGKTVPTPVTNSQPTIQPESVSPAMYHLLYTCVLIPRFPHHHLAGDLAARLSEWVPQICVAFGWRVEHISVRPTYLEWIVNVSPSTSPGYVMRIIRKITSQRIFNEYPRFKSELPAEDFWAPGYLVVSSPDSPPHQVIHNYIAYMRKRQGLSGR